MISIGAIIVIALVIGLVALIYLNVIRLLQSETTSSITKVAVCVLLIILVVLPGYLLLALRRTPPAQAISDVLDITDASRQLSIRSIRMPAPAYISGRGTIEKSYASIVSVDVANDSDQERCLGLEYYTDSGSIGPYSPGVTSAAMIVPVPANWAGELQFPLRHLRFVAGGYVRLTLAKCKTATSQVVFLPPESEQLFEKKYDIVSE